MVLDVLYEIDVPKPWGKPHPYGQREAELASYKEAFEREVVTSATITAT